MIVFKEVPKIASHLGLYQNREKLGIVALEKALTFSSLSKTNWHQLKDSVVF